MGFCACEGAYLRRTLVPPSHYSSECFGGITPKEMILSIFYGIVYPPLSIMMKVKVPAALQGGDNQHQPFSFVLCSIAHAVYQHSYTPSTASK